MTPEELEKKWLNNELSESEKALYEQLEEAKLNNEIIENAQYFKASNVVVTEPFDTFKYRYFKNKSPIKKLSVFIKIAAILIVGLGLYYLAFNDSLTHFETLIGEKQTVALPDHSLVTMNAESAVEYNQRKWKENRIIKLEGEAYFKVTKGHTFDVLTRQGVVMVVGTQFNVKDREDYFEVKCFEGIVKVHSGTVTRFLHAGDTFRYMDGQLIESKTKVKAPEWTQNMSVFDAVPIKEVFSELERQYNVKIHYAMNGNRLFTGGFVHDNLKNALMAITQPMDLTYEMNSSNLIEIHEKKD